MEQQRSRSQVPVTLAVLTAVVLVDQLSKWWAWRHVPYAQINPGGTGFLGSTVSAWYSSATLGAVLDVVSAQVLALGAFVLLRRPRPAAVLVPAALMIGGWASNLLDRLGLHLLTAPGAWRGAVDFLRMGDYLWNLADLCIAVGTLLFAVAVLRRGVRRAGRSSAQVRPWRSAGRWAVLAAVAPLLLGTAATVTASGGLLTG